MTEKAEIPAAVVARSAGAAGRQECKGFSSSLFYRRSEGSLPARIVSMAVKPRGNLRGPKMWRFLVIGELFLQLDFPWL